MQVAQGGIYFPRRNKIPPIQNAQKMPDIIGHEKEEEKEMTIETNILGMTIEIKAKGLYNPDRYNKEDLYAFLNLMSGYAREAGNSFNQRGADNLSKQAYDFADLIYEELKNKGYYNNL